MIASTTYFIIAIISIIAIYDLLHCKIPNHLILVLTAVAISHMLITHGLHGFILSIGGLFLGMALLMIPYAMGGMAAGDVKLMGAVGAALGPAGVFMAFLYSAVAGGLYALGLMLAGRAGTFPGRLWDALKTFYLTRQIIFDKAASPEQTGKLCYGVAIAAGSILYIVLEMTGKGQVVQLWR